MVCSFERAIIVQKREMTSNCGRENLLGERNGIDLYQMRKIPAYLVNIQQIQEM